MLLIKSFIIGLAKIIPGVSGAMVAIYLNLYERMLDSVTHFFDDWKNNLKFIVTFLLGIILAVIIGSKIILFLFKEYEFITMMLFIGIFFGGTINFAKKIEYDYQKILLIFITIIVFLFFSLIKINNSYHIQNNFTDNIILFLGGGVDMFASIVPSISGTSLLMTIGIYHNVLELISHAYEINYVIKYLNLYLSYLLGMSSSFFINAYIINYCFKKYKNTTYIIILSLSISSILYLLINTLKIYYTPVELIIGINLLFLGALLGTILDK